MSSSYKTPEQLVELINSSNRSKPSRLDYYKKILSACYSDIGFQTMVNTISFKEIVPLPKNNSMYRFVVKCYNNSTNVVVGAVSDNANATSALIPNSSDVLNLSDLSIPMSHYHLNKNNYVQDNFIHKITNNENPSTVKFIERIRLVDERIKYLISDYIKNINMNSLSPIANLLRKNNVTYNQNWIYTGIINKGKEDEYINFRYFKDAVNSKSKIGTNIYCGDTYSNEIADLLSRNTFSYIHGNIYPILKVNYVLVNERIVNGTSMVNFTCKAYFVDINFSLNSVRCSTKRL